MEDNELLLFDCLINIADDFLAILESEGASTYYSITLNKVINKKDIIQIIKESKETLNNNLTFLK